MCIVSQNEGEGERRSREVKGEGGREVNKLNMQSITMIELGRMYQAYVLQYIRFSPAFIHTQT